MRPTFDEGIVTTSTAGQQTTLPIWMLGEPVRPRQRPVTDIVAVFVIALTLVPILVAYRVTVGTETVAGTGQQVGTWAARTPARKPFPICRHRCSPACAAFR